MLSTIDETAGRATYADHQLGWMDEVVVKNGTKHGRAEFACRAGECYGHGVVLLGLGLGGKGRVLDEINVEKVAMVLTTVDPGIHVGMRSWQKFYWI